MAEPEDDDFLSRWSRRKRGEHPEQEPDDSVAQAADAPNAPNAPNAADAADAEPTDEEAEGDPEVIAQLPEIDGMDDSSDFSVFLKAGVPEALRRRALRKLWRVNPVLANLDGLNDYDGDYTQMSALGQGMKTLYQVGKGFATDDSDAVAEDEPPSDAPAATDEPETQLSELPPPNESESQTTALSEAPGRAEPRVREPVKSTRDPKSTASSRRWGTPETPS